MASRLEAIGGYLHVFEPVHANCSRLQENLAINGLQFRATVHECALSSCSGTAEIKRGGDFLAGSETGNATVVFSRCDRKMLSVEQTTVRRLDDLIQEIRLERLDLIKLDIEGHETDFLRGGADVISRFLPIIYLEVNKYFRRELDLWKACKETAGGSYLALLPKWQRRARWRADKTLLAFQRIENLSVCEETDNIFLVPPPRLDDVAAIAPILAQDS
jgi:FkbM family methyltransferase